MSRVYISSVSSSYGHVVGGSQTGYCAYTCGAAYGGGGFDGGGEFIEF